VARRAKWEPSNVIDREGMTPLYLQVADLIASRIRSGELAPNRPVPSEHELAATFGVARGTARKALGVLKDRGLVVAVNGRGTFVREKP
jgi:GntR family transcriptional regulator